MDSSLSSSDVWLDATRAAEILGVKRATLYAYVSRGQVRSHVVPGARGRRYHRDDVLRLRTRSDARKGHGAVAAGALRFGEPILDSAITDIRPGGPHYRGYSAVELSGHARFEEVCGILWESADAFANPPRVSVPRITAARPFQILPRLVPAIAHRDPDRGLRAERLTAERLLTQLVRALDPGADAQSTIASSLLVALGGKPIRSHVRAMERALIVIADHELNPSSFTARVTASAGADLYACVSAALATLSGSKHGGMSDRVEALLDEIGSPRRAIEVARDRAQRGEALPGFGHPLYPDGDPRARVVLDNLPKKTKGASVALTLRDAVALAGGEAPTVDLALAALARSLSLVPGAALAIFAVGRTAGYVAHVLEQRGQPLVRPRARYIGD